MKLAAATATAVTVAEDVATALAVTGASTMVFVRGGASGSGRRRGESIFRVRGGGGGGMGHPRSAVVHLGQQQRELLLGEIGRRARVGHTVQQAGAQHIDVVTVHHALDELVHERRKVCAEVCAGRVMRVPQGTVVRESVRLSGFAVEGVRKEKTGGLPPW
jgi:hypothetical protein